MVVVLAPLLDFPSCFVQRSEPVLIQAFVAELAVQTFHEGVLRRLAWLDKTKLGLPFFGPEEELW